MSKVAVVTGSNKGIGYAIVRYLCRNFEGTVYLTARDEGRGKAAVEDLAKEGCQSKFHQLDLDNQDSVEKFASFIKSTHGGLDILVNNAGIAYKGASTAPFTEQAEVSVATNFWGTLRVCDALFPLLNPHARVVHLSSFVSTMTFKKCSDDLKQRIKACQSIGDVKSLMTEFVTSVKDGTFKDKGWPQSAYGVSKVGVSAITAFQQAELDKSGKEDIIVNSACPGHVATDMSSHTGNKSIDEGADTPFYLAMLPPGTKEPRGTFVSDRVAKDWTA